MLATTLDKALLVHFKSINVNELGGMLLARDLQEYIECISIFKNEAADALFQKLREASAVLMVPPQNIVKLRKGQMANIETDVLVVFAKMRADWKSAKLAQYFVERDQHGPPATGGGGGNGGGGSGGTNQLQAAANLGL